MQTILIVDDDETQRMTCAHFLSRKLGYATEEAVDGEQAVARLMDITKPLIDLVLLDLYMPTMDGRNALPKIRAAYPTLPVIMLTASSDIEDAVILMQLGASDFITKPFSPERLKISIEQHLTLRALSGEVARLKRKQDGHGQFDDLIGAETGLAACVTFGRKAAVSGIPVLITGESGVGKELLARAIHGESPRAGRMFVAINCGAIPENLVESTLFGHEKGSFTGAIARELGKFREADGGTLFLDEVGELKADMQTKLLRVLQQKEIQPVGAGKPVKVNVRIISATNRNLAQEVGEGKFRDDLYYRLNVLPIHMPPLRERREDIAILAGHLLSRFCATEHKPLLRLSEGGLKWLMQQEWPGNVRELENLLYRAVVLSEKEALDETDFIAMTSQGQQTGTAYKQDYYVTLLDSTGRAKTWDALEAEIIAATLRRSGDNIAEAAKHLQMGQSTLYKKLAESQKGKPTLISSPPAA